jgi:hypothetical protein
MYSFKLEKNFKTSVYNLKKSLPLILYAYIENNVNRKWL